MPATAPAAATPITSPNREFLVGLARGVAGALIFALPMLMTSELWALGAVMDRLRLVVLIVGMIPLLVGLSHYIGFEPTFDVLDDIVDTFVAYAIGFVTAVAVLTLFGVIDRAASWDEVTGKAALLAVPGSIGALLALSLLGQKEEEALRPDRQMSYGSELFVMTVGAVFLGFNVAPTDEVVQISFMLARWQSVALAIVSLLLMHAFVYSERVGAMRRVPHDASGLSEFVRFTVAGYAVALLTSVTILWLFGRTDGLAAVELLNQSVVLAFPSSIGAAAARLVL